MAIHLYTEDGEYSIWTDCEPGHHHSGRCLAFGRDLEETKAEARAELQGDLFELDRLTDRQARTPESLR